MEACKSYGPPLLEVRAPRISFSAGGIPKGTNDVHNVHEGDLVLVVDKNSPHGCRPLVCVLRVFLEMMGDSEQLKLVPRVRPTSDLSLSYVY